MKALLQRVTAASVSVDDEVVGCIGRGLLVFVGVANGDTEEDVEYLSTKTVALRIFGDETGKFNLSVEDIAGELLVVSQFTLLATTRKGRRPGFSEAAPPECAEPLYERFVQLLEETGLQAACGVFGAHMVVDLDNDGPVALMVESP